MYRTPVRLLILTLTTMLTALVLPATAQAAPYCGITWGSLAEANSAGDTESLNGVRSGRHACFDRLVIDVSLRGSSLEGFRLGGRSGTPERYVGSGDGGGGECGHRH